MWLATVFMMIASIFAGIYYFDRNDSVGDLGDYGGQVVSSAAVIQAERLMLIHQAALRSIETGVVSFPSSGETNVDPANFSLALPTQYNLQPDETAMWTTVLTASGEVVTYTTYASGVDPAPIAAALKRLNYDAAVVGLSSGNTINSNTRLGADATTGTVLISLPMSVPNNAAVIYTAFIPQ